MFEGPEYASYRDLCRELRLPHEFEEGDCFLDDKPERLIGDAIYPAEVTEPRIDGMAVGWEDVERAGEYSVWLPRLDQWYALIRQTWARGGGPSICLYGDDEVGYACESDDRSITMRGKGKTPEEAAARLCVAVAGWAIRA
jgi:hypothetical protein